jgi:hypothetical protein
MTPMIKKLAEEAGFVLWGDEDYNPGDVIDWSSRYDAELEKFARLVAEECASICDAYGMPDSTSQTAMILSSAIKKRFGIEK